MRAGATRLGADRHRRIDALHVALLDQNLARLGTQLFHLSLLDVLASPKLLDLPVQNRGHRACTIGSEEAVRPARVCARCGTFAGLVPATALLRVSRPEGRAS